MKYDLAIDDYSDCPASRPGVMWPQSTFTEVIFTTVQSGTLIQPLTITLMPCDINLGDKHTYVRRALAYSDKGEYDRAIEDYDAALRLDSQSEYEIYVLRARAYAQ